VDEFSMLWCFWRDSRALRQELDDSTHWTHLQIRTEITPARYTSGEEPGTFNRAQFRGKVQRNDCRVFLPGS
jgi:hypothetical protein